MYNFKNGAKLHIFSHSIAISSAKITFFSRKVVYLHHKTDFTLMKKIAVLTGAGMSVESGLKTFRDADGLWENYPVSKVATHEGWEADPTLSTQRAIARDV